MCTAYIEALLEVPFVRAIPDSPVTGCSLCLAQQIMISMSVCIREDLVTINRIRGDFEIRNLYREA